MKIGSGKLVVLGIWTAFFLLALYIAFWLFSAQPDSLRTAAYRGDSEQVAKILGRRPEWVNMPDKYGMTALHQAMSRMDDATVDLLLAKGADVNATNYLGAAALHLAAGAKTAGLERQKSVIERLLAKGADASLKDGRGRTPLALMDTNANPGLALWFRQKSARQ